MKSQEYYQQRIERLLEETLPQQASQTNSLNEAMRYSVLGGGKRIRPLLVYATGEALNLPVKQLDVAAVAVELIHAYSLVHDDLPCMDDDDLRRGKETTHIKFDEAIAVLTGDALQTLAFEILSNSMEGVSAENQLKVLKTLTSASGATGMVLGQAIDLAAVGKSLNEAQLGEMHSHKTGAIICASVAMATYCRMETKNSKEIDHKREALLSYATAIGLAFQVRDDILDIQSDTETLGKTQGADIAAGKPTYPSIIGMENAKTKLYQLYEKSINALSIFGNEADLLRDIARFIVKRIA